METVKGYKRAWPDSAPLPPHWELNIGVYAEPGLLQTLELGLSSAYTLFHSVDWSKGAGEKDQHGEIDIVVVNQTGDVLLIEVKVASVTDRRNSPR